MPEICRFFGIIIRMFFEDHDPPHFHAEYSGRKAIFDFRGNILKGDLGSRTATKLVREWIDLHVSELEENWKLARSGEGLE
ncbi:MAG: DUF4160 domain-containing protein, partial [Desulfococcaceae bacterium]